MKKYTEVKVNRGLEFPSTGILVQYINSETAEVRFQDATIYVKTSDIIK